MAINFVDKHPVRQFSAITADDGVVICDKEQGAFLVLRCKEDINNLKKLLEKIEIIEVDEK